ncbi:hypothetical protein AB0G42_15755 [Streptomyces yangpuensis]
MAGPWGPAFTPDPSRPALLARACVLGLLDSAAWPPRAAAAGPLRP